MKIKIVADSSADLLVLEGVAFSCIPLTIIANEKEYVDDVFLNIDEMVRDLSEYKGKSGTSCPSCGVWLESFEGFDEIYVVTITSKLSGSYNSASIAKKMYLESNPNVKIHVFDSLSTGPEMQLLIEKILELIKENNSFDDVVTKATNYLSNTELFFSLESLHNLAHNGRISRLSEFAAKILNIRIVGKAYEGQLQLLNKCIGFKRTFRTVIEHLINAKYRGGKIRISHVNNLEFANSIKGYFVDLFKEVDIKICNARGLVTYYAESGGILIGFETE